VRVILTANVNDRCPGKTNPLNSTCTVSENPQDLTFIYQLYSSEGALVNNSLASANLLDSQVVQYQPVVQDSRDIVLLGVVNITDNPNNALYLNVAYATPELNTLSPNYERFMSLDVVLTLLGLPLPLNGRRKKDLDDQYRRYFMEEAISPKELEMEINF